MATSKTEQQLDLLWKKLLFGVSQTGINKSVYEELSHSANSVRATEIWREDSQILIPAAPVEGIVEAVNIRLIPDLSDKFRAVWVAGRAFANGITVDNRLADFISPRVHPTYEVKLFSDAGMTTPILNSNAQTEWFFDYESGILWFPNSDETNQQSEVYLAGYRYIGLKGMNPTFSGDVIDVLGPLTDGNFDNGYVPNFQSGVTKIADAVNAMNVAMRDFIPASPPPLSEQFMVVPGATSVIDDANLVLASGFLDVSGNFDIKPNPGNIVGKIAGLNVESSFVGPFGDGRTGTLSVLMNQQVIGSRELTIGDDTGVYGSLYINQETNYGMAMASFWEVITAKAVSVTFPKGLNSLYMQHSVTGDSNVVFLVNDSSNVLPTVNTVGTRVDDFSVEYSSGIPHYSRGTRIHLSANVDNLATDLALDTRNVVFSSAFGDAGPNVWAYPGVTGLPSVLTKGENYQIEDVVFEINDFDDIANHGTTRFRATARNANGTHELIGSDIFNYMRDGTVVGMSPVIENSIPVENLGTIVEGFELDGKRILLGGGDTPAFNGTVQPWDSTAELPLYEAAVVGGALRFSRSNFAVGYFPAGPNYSTHNNIQYATFAIQRQNVSLLNIEVEGKYSGLQVMLPGIAGQTLTANGWMDCFSPYVGYGVPGREVTAGCALGTVATGGTQVVTATFGYESSSNSTDNLILVRFRMQQGDSITGLRFSGVSR